MEQNETKQENEKRYEEKNANKPEMKFKAGPISATVWQNSAEGKTG